MTNRELESEGDDASANAPPNLLEEKYRKQMRQIHPQKIELPISTLQAMIKEQITLNPEFQRRDRWDNKKRSRFVESVIMNVPVPPVFLGEDEYGAYVVLDGRQRLTAIHEFLNNAFPLEGLTVWKELNGSRYVDLEKSGLNKTLTRRFIPAILLLKESSPEVKYDVFDRLNTGGVKANEMEIRNAVFRGEFTKLLHTSSALSNFRKLWGIPEDLKNLVDNTLYSTMEDVEYVLRFFALRDAALIEGRFKDYLSYFMKAKNEAYSNDAGLRATDEAIFRDTINTTYQLLADEAFMRPSTDGKPRRSAPLADAVLYAMSYVDAQKIKEGDSERIKQALNGLLSVEAFASAISSGTNGKGAIIERTTLARRAVAEAVPHAIKE
jgi:hypothetical protein